MTRASSMSIAEVGATLRPALADGPAAPGMQPPHGHHGEPCGDERRTGACCLPLARALKPNLIARVSLKSESQLEGGALALHTLPLKAQVGTDAFEEIVEGRPYFSRHFGALSQGYAKMEL